MPDKALAPNGRTLKCAKCSHKWFQTASRPEDDFGLDESSFPPPPLRPDPEPERRPMFSADPDVSFDATPPVSAAARAAADLDVDLDEPPYHNFGSQPRGESQGTDLDLDGVSEPIPDVFSNAPKTKSGTGGLWFLLFVLLLGGAAGGAYYFQDKIIDLWPPAHDLLNDMNLRREKPGAGLELRNAGTPERFVQNDTEVLIVRGIIANISDRERAVPTMKLVLLDRDKAVVQEKQSQPPVTSLDPGGTAGFRIILERPDANAVEVNVLFLDPNEAAK
ncbi:MAG: DUF3426 domain-containing protein [Rhodospirillaceae bacterium]|nr:DUF3426 domain-containing protein [Rhodospirillales bacterium]